LEFRTLLFLLSTSIVRRFVIFWGLWILGRETSHLYLYEIGKQFWLVLRAFPFTPLVLLCGHLYQCLLHSKYCASFFFFIVAHKQEIMLNVIRRVQLNALTWVNLCDWPIKAIVFFPGLFRERYLVHFYQFGSSKNLSSHSIGIRLESQEWVMSPFHT